MPIFQTLDPLSYGFTMYSVSMTSKYDNSKNHDEMLVMAKVQVNIDVDQYVIKCVAKCMLFTGEWSDCIASFFETLEKW